MPLLRVDADDGWPLAVARLPAFGERRGVVVTGHAMMCSRRTLERGLARTLRQRGYEVWNFDVRGHGESGPPASTGATWSYDDIVMRDIPAVVSAAREAHPTLPLALLGHSLCGHAGQAWLGQVAARREALPVDALVGMAANVWLPRFEPNRRRWLRKRATIEAVTALCRAHGYLPVRRLKFGTDDEPLPYFEQFVDWARHDRWRSADGQRDYLAGALRLRLPTLHLVGAGDQLECHPEASAQWALTFGGEHRVVVKGDFRPDHMGLVTHRQAVPIWRDVADWLDAHLEARP